MNHKCIVNAARALLVAGLLFTLSGCVPVGLLNPVFRDSDLVFEPRLEGSWVAGGETWKFEPNARDYTLTYSKVEADKGYSATFKARLVRLSGVYFLDLFPEGELTPPPNDAYCVAIVPVHLVARVAIEGDTLRVAFLDDSWLHDQVIAAGEAVAYADLKDSPESDDGRLVLTGSTADVQAFLARHAYDKWPEENTLTRAHQQ